MKIFRVLAIATLASSLALGCTAGSAESPAGSPAPAQTREEATFDRALARRMSVGELQERLAAGETPTLVDARPPGGDDTIRDAVHVPLAELAAWAKDKPRDALIVAYCA